MCTCLILVVPAEAHLARAIALAGECGFRASTDLWSGLPRTAPGMQLLDPDDSQCYCGTRIGSEHRRAIDPEHLVRMSREGPRARWSAAKQRRWVEQKLQSSHRPVSRISEDAEPELARWVRLAHVAASSRDVGRIGVVVQDASDEVTAWLPATSSEATPAALLAIAPLTPTWLVPCA